MDRTQGQKVLEAVRLECPDVILLFVPPNLTSKFQPLDAAINGTFKLVTKHIYAEWAGLKLSEAFERGEDTLGR